MKKIPQIKKKVYTGIRTLFMMLPESIIRFYEIYVEYKLGKRYYKNNKICSTDNHNYVVSIFEDKVNPGGLTDRIFGMVSGYYVAKICKKDYKIYHDLPFPLDKFLDINKVNWKIAEKDIAYNLSDSKILFIRSLMPPRKDARLRRLINIINRTQYKNIHLYSNLNIFPPAEFAHLYKELFKPSENLMKQISIHKEKIGGAYISITFRFQQLLGDFKEGDYEILGEAQRKKLIEECIKAVGEIMNDHPDKKCLVTSDSLTFLEKVKLKNNVYVIPGKVVHMAYSLNDDYEIYLKSFIDLYMISEAEKIYSVKIGKMYNSGFPVFASLINNRPFELREIPEL